MSQIPETVRQRADARRDARIDRNFAEADRLKGEIEAAGWKVVDDGLEYRLMPANPPDVIDGSRTLHGWSGAVPSRLAEAASFRATIVTVLTNGAGDRAMAADDVGDLDGTQQVLVANGLPSDAATPQLRPQGTTDGIRSAAAPEIVWLARRLGVAAALNAGIRRAAGAIVIVRGPDVTLEGDIVTPLEHALADPATAVTGPWGLVSGDGRHFEPAAGQAARPGSSVAAIEGALIAFRRSDFVERGPLDERFDTADLLDAWWSLVLRDDPAGGPARRAIISAVPAGRAPVDRTPPHRDGEAGRAERRGRYRLLERFGDRRDLAVTGPR
jgi:hypothetical protein